MSRRTPSNVVTRLLRAGAGAALSVACVVVGGPLVAASRTDTAELRLAQATDPRRAAAEQLFDDGLAHANRHNHKAAVESYRMGLRIMPTSAVAHYYLAESLKALGDESLAMTHYKEAARLGPSTKEGIIAAAIVEASAENDRKRQEKVNLLDRLKAMHHCYRIELPEGFVNHVYPRVLLVSERIVVEHQFRTLQVSGRYHGNAQVDRVDFGSLDEFNAETMSDGSFTIRHDKIASKFIWFKKSQKELSVVHFKERHLSVRMPTQSYITSGFAAMEIPSALDYGDTCPGGRPLFQGAQ